jgi:hypothetical protein
MHSARKTCHTVFSGGPGVQGLPCTLIEFDPVNSPTRSHHYGRSSNGPRFRTLNNMKISAGLLVHRMREGQLEVLLVHP